LNDHAGDGGPVERRGAARARSALLVVNAKSRQGAAARDEIEQRLAAHGVASSHRDCDGRDAMSALIAAEGPAHDLVVVGGGDGTLNAAAKGLIEAGRPLGVIPTGTANDLARTLGLPLDIEGAARVAATGRPRRIDLGSVNGEPFFNVASMGLSVEIARRLTSDVKRRFGKLGYAVAAAAALSRARPLRAHIRGDGRDLRMLALQVSVGNGRFYGGGNQVSERAEIDDGRLDVYALKFVKAWRLVLMLRSLRAGEHGAWREIERLTGAEFEVRTRRPRSVNADGEIITQTPARFEVLPGALDVMVPSKGAA
jgi:diacylglycerol kinase (ATP)